MYETPKKLEPKKKIELILMLIAIFWGILFIINYVRYTSSKPPILALHLKREYDDGRVDEYLSFGYVYRSYNRNSIKREEFVPFWIGMENPEAELDLPEALTGYEVPENIRKEDKFRGLLYFYNKKLEFLGTYKCINTKMDCNKAFGGYDQYNTVNKDAMTALEKPHVLGNIHDKFAFVDDSLEQDTVYGNANYARTVYLYQFLEEDPLIIAKFADVKESTYDDNRELAYGDSNKYIVKSMENNKWGIINISESGKITEVLPYEYDSISYDSDTKYYIICKDEVWYVYDLNKKEVVSVESADPIYDVWRNGNLTYYFKTGKDRTVGNDTFVDYKIYRFDGKDFLNKDKVTQVLFRSNYVMYVTSNDNVLHFMDYSGEEKYKIQLLFSNMFYSELTHPAFEIYYENINHISIRVWQGRELSYDYENFSVNVKNWENNFD